MTTVKFNVKRKNGIRIVTTRLLMEPLDTYSGRRRNWRLVEDFIVTLHSPGHIMRVKVPGGFSTDMATLPIIAQLFVGNRDDHLVAAVIHDYLIYTNVPRWVCNSWLRTMMYCNDAPMWKQIGFFWAVHLFGYKSLCSRIFRWIKNAIRR